MNIDLTTLSAEALLSIPADKPERLFKGSLDDVKQAYRLLAMKWHPDRNRDPDALAVFQHIRRTVGFVEQKSALGVWPCRGTAHLTAVDGREYEINYLRRHRFELGTMYVAATVVAFEIDRIHADLVRSAERMLNRFRYADAQMHEQISRLLPPLPFAGVFQTAGAYVIVMRKRPDLLLLRDVLDHFRGCLDPRHVAWVISSLLNLCCYFEYAGMTHNALSPETCFISPPDHSVTVLGGWWYATSTAERMLAAPAGTIKWGPHNLLAAGHATIRTDLEMIRAVGRELLGDIAGTSLGRKHAANQAMIDWLNMPASDNPVEEYRTWQTQVLQASFGARRFAELPLKQSDIYL